MNKVVITGVSTGIGYSSVKILCNAGYTVYGSVRKRDDAERVMDKFGENFHPLIFDVTDAQGILDGAAKVKSELDEGECIAGLVNNAGVLALAQLEEFKLEDFDRTIAVNVRSVFVAAQEATRHMGEGGRIITIGSRISARERGGGGAMTPVVCMFMSGACCPYVNLCAIVSGFCGQSAAPQTPFVAECDHSPGG